MPSEPVRSRAVRCIKTPLFCFSSIFLFSKDKCIVGMLLDKRKSHFSSTDPNLEETDPKIIEEETPNGVAECEKDMWSKAIWLYFDVANIAKPKF